ncbi:Cg30-like protein [Glossina pallidipes salivary gland hypertrophy virus]|uniref:Cg30-like protein n=1 Tax=Glossina hytrovirus (isolate Glossina pallidipes/Ethiopia/Seibersdorf/-) TaxID=379529 RepID=A0A0Y0LT63_GHVS|nr:Cg30-like protein [Glossina pallidipes salivary gland hypertrophy virus]
MEEQKKYFNYLRHSKLNIACSYCEKLIILNKYNQHIKKVHNINTTFLCIWCLNYKWTKNNNSNNYEHRFNCMISKLNLSLSPSAISDSEENEMNLFLNCKKCDDFLKDNVYINRHLNYIQEPLQTIHFGSSIATNWNLVQQLMPADNDDWNNFSTLQPIEPLGFDIRWPTVFLHVKNVSWFHCSFRYHIWDDVYALINNNTSKLCILNHWCLCNASQPDNLEARHRHIILFVINSYKYKFFKSLSLITLKNKQKLQESSFMEGKKTIKARLTKPINTIAHLLNAIQYVSHKRSTCDGKTILTSDNDLEIGYSYSHYYINNPVLYTHFKFLCMGLFPDSQRIITEILISNRYIENIHKKVSLDKKTIQYQYLYTKKDHILPFEHVLTKLDNLPTPIEPNQVAEYNKTTDEKIIYLYENLERVYYKMSATLLYSKSTNEQFNTQNYRGNKGLINAFGEAEFPLSKNHIALLNIVINSTNDLTRQISQLKTENVELRKRVEQLKAEDEQLKAENVINKNNIEKLKAENVELRKRVEQLEDVINKNNIIDLKKRIAELEKNSPTKDMIIYDLKQEIRHLKEENCILKRKNEDLISFGCKKKN